MVIAGSLTYILYQTDQLQPLPPTRLRRDIRADRLRRQAVEEKKEEIAAENVHNLEVLPFKENLEAVVASSDDSAWGSFSTKFALFSSVTDLQWSSVPQTIVDFVMP